MNENQFKIMDRNHVLIMILLMLITVILLVHPVQAMNITMANPSSISDRDIIVFDSLGQTYGLYNSTSTISLNGTEDYIFTLKPARTNPLEDPYDWVVNEAFPFLESNFIALAILGAVIGIVFRKWLI